jgi:hypothetical protein
MLSSLENSKKYGSIAFIAVALIFIFVAGVFFAMTYYVMDITQDALEGTDCTFENNSLVGSCQDLYAYSFYPVLQLRSILVWFSYFFIFGLVISMLVVGYKSGSSSVLMGVNVLFTILFTYGGIEISNVYRTLLDNELFRNMMIPFRVYNNIMINCHWFIFIICLASLGLGIVNFQKAPINEDPNINNY